MKRRRNSLGNILQQRIRKFNRRFVVAVLVAIVTVGGVAIYRLQAATGVIAGSDEQRDIAYANTSGSQKLDLYLPQRYGTAIPLVIHVHGGAFSGGSKGEDLDMLDAVLDKGWALADIEYRRSGEARFPAGVQDVKAAVRWLRANAAEYGIDANKFAVWGESAGGYLVEAIGVSGGMSSTFDDPGLGNPTVSSAVQAVISLYGPTNFSTMTQHGRETCGNGADEHDSAGTPEGQWLGGAVQSSPLLQSSILENYVTTSHPIPPFYLAHGTGDCTVGFGQSVEMQEKLQSINRPVTLKPYDGLGHADSRIKSGTVAPGIAFAEAAFAAAEPTVTPQATATPQPTSTPTPRPSTTPTPGTTTTPMPSGSATPTPTAVAPSPTPSIAEGDLDHDGTIGLNDLNLLILSWNGVSGNRDVNGDGKVNVYDLSVLLSNWE